MAGSNVQQGLSFAAPSLADQGAVGQVPHVAEHAAIFGHGLLVGVVGVVQGMRADRRKDLGEDGTRQPLREVAAGDWGRIAVGGAEIMLGDAPSELSGARADVSQELLHGVRDGLLRPEGCMEEVVVVR